MNQELSPEAIAAWINLGARLTELGIDAAVRIKSAIAAFHAGASEEQMALIINGVQADASRRKALADADAVSHLD